VNAIAEQKLARIDERLAELLAEESQLYAERAKILRGEAPGTEKRRSRREPEVPEPSEMDRARARVALRQSDLDRRLSR
jgi:hypothetical protein